jgi:hypothetical protein
MAGGAATALGQTSTPGLVIGRDDFTTLRWVAGSWKGTAEHQPAIYEHYVFEDDSTLMVQSYSDSHLKNLHGTTRYALRNHRVIASGDGATWLAVKLDSSSIEFTPLTGTKTTFSWKEENPDRFVAVTTWPPTVDVPARTVTYHMSRTSRK